MMRMKGHAIHDAAEYVPKPLFEYWKKRDCIARFENYLVNAKKWLSPPENQALIADVDRQLEEDREYAVSSPMPGSHEIKPKYAMPKQSVTKSRAATPKQREAAVHLK